MIRNLTLSSKLFIILIPLFALMFGIIVYFNYRFEEQQTLELARIAADAQAVLIKQSLVHMMTTRFEVDDKYLTQITRPGELENVQVFFRFDSLLIDSEFLKPERIPVLRARESRFKDQWTDQIERVFSTGDSLYAMTCDSSKHPSLFGKHDDYVLESFTSGIPMKFWTCARLHIVLPFKAEEKCQQCHDVALGHVLGAASMEIPFSRPVSAIRANVIRSLAIFLVLTIAVTTFGTFIFKRIVAKPINLLVQATKVIGTGNLDEHLKGGFGNDELGQLAASFDEMQKHLKGAQEELIRQERLSTIGRMAGSIIHDFRNPMTNIFLALELLEPTTGMASEQRRAMVNQIRLSVERMARMAQELLDFSRGEVRLELKTVTISEFVKGISSSVEDILSKNNIRWIVEQQFDAAFTIDIDRLQRAIINIINNAVDVLPNGGEIRLRIFRQDSMIVFSVSDNGPGIPKSIRDTVFLPFVTEGKPNGTGLGLAITRRIVEQHGGQVNFTTEEGKGTTFSVKIP